MPPIMGSGAFVMAELLGVSYGSIALAALIPALLFYMGVFLSVHLQGIRFGYKGMASEEIPKPKDFMALRRSIPLFAPLGLLVGLLVMGFTPTFAGFWAIACSIITYIAIETPTSGIKTVSETLKAAFIDAGKGLVTVAVLIACAQIMLVLIASTGLGVKVSAAVVTLGANSLVLSLLLAMALAIILGMGLPTAAAYLLAASVIAPALESLGISGVQAHLFIFYFAIVAGITPPLCAGIFIAASMADAPWTETLGHAMRISFAALVVPFAFVMYGELLMDGTTQEIILRFTQACLAIAATTVALSGYFKQQLTMQYRLLIGFGACFLLAPFTYVSLIGLAILSCSFALLWKKSEINSPCHT